MDLRVCQISSRYHVNPFESSSRALLNNRTQPARLFRKSISTSATNFSAVCLASSFGVTPLRPAIFTSDPFVSRIFTFSVIRSRIAEYYGVPDALKPLASSKSSMSRLSCSRVSIMEMLSPSAVNVEAAVVCRGRLLYSQAQHG